MSYHPLTNYRSSLSSFNGIYLKALVLRVVKCCFLKWRVLSNELTLTGLLMIWVILGGVAKWYFVDFFNISYKSFYATSKTPVIKKIS